MPLDIERLVPLNPEDLIEQAKAATGLDDFGSDE